MIENSSASLSTICLTVPEITLAEQSRIPCRQALPPLFVSQREKANTRSESPPASALSCERVRHSNLLDESILVEALPGPSWVHSVAEASGAHVGVDDLG
jgi:hypothetical protein